MNSPFFLLLFLPYSSLSATIDSAATEDYDGYAMQSLQLPYHREVDNYRVPLFIDYLRPIDIETMFRLLVRHNWLLRGMKCN